MAFTAKILSWRFRHLNIVGCLLKRRPSKGGSQAPHDPPSYAPESSLMADTNKPTKLVLNSVIVMLNSFNCGVSETDGIYKFHTDYSDYYYGPVCI